MGLMWWMLAREVLCKRGTTSREHPWEVMPDLYYREPGEIEKREDFRVKGLLQLRSSLQLNPRPGMGLMTSGCLCAYSAVSY